LAVAIACCVQALERELDQADARETAAELQARLGLRKLREVPDLTAPSLST
jgi:hypothetical protein